MPGRPRTGHETPRAGRPRGPAGGAGTTNPRRKGSAMAVAGRLKRLEAVLAGKNPSGGRMFDQFLDDIGKLDAWREACGYPDLLAAQEAGETGPVGLEDLLEEYATYDHKHRVWARIESADR